MQRLAIVGLWCFAEIPMTYTDLGRVLAGYVDLGVVRAAVVVMVLWAVVMTAVVQARRFSAVAAPR
jgi:hypothetical protein